MPLFSRLKYFFCKAEHQVTIPDTFIMPNPLVPWELWPDVNPDVMGCRHGPHEDWLLNIWVPYWQSLSEQQRLDFLSKSPLGWKEWIERAAKLAETIPPGFDLKKSLDSYMHRYYMWQCQIARPKRKIVGAYVNAIAKIVTSRSFIIAAVICIFLFASIGLNRILLGMHQLYEWLCSYLFN